MEKKIYDWGLDMYLALDIGTTVAKAVLFDRKGKERFVVERACEIIRNSPNTAEQKAEEIRQAIVFILKEAIIKENADNIQAIVLSTQGGSFVPIQADGRCTSNIMTWMDGRAKDIVDQWYKDGTAQRIRELSGWWVEEGLPIATIEWFRRNRPDDFEKTDYFLSLNDFIGFLLTGNLVTNLSCAGEMLLVNSHTATWDNELCNLVGIETSQLSKILPAEGIIGSLSNDIKENLGITKDIPVINGGQDHTLEALAVGLTQEGKALLACGTAWVINAICDTDRTDDAPTSMGVNFHVLDQKRVISQYIGCFGAVMEWWVNQFWQSPRFKFDRNELYERMSEKMSKEFDSPENLIYLPFAGGKQIKGNRTSGHFLGMNIGYSRQQVTHSLMEGIVFEVLWAIENLIENGQRINELWMIGGATRNNYWTKMVANILNIPVRISDYSHGPALGAAMIAAVSTGQFKDYSSCRKVFSIKGSRIMPNNDNREYYDNKYKEFKKWSKIINAFPNSK